jgi:hypothetical protein
MVTQVRKRFWTSTSRTNDRYRKPCPCWTVPSQYPPIFSGVNMKTTARQLFAALAAAAASSGSTCTDATEISHPYPVPDAFLGDRPYPNEEDLAQRLSLVIDETVRRQYPSGTARRDAHAKGHGCVKAEFRVDENLDPRPSFREGRLYTGQGLSGLGSVLQRQSRREQARR